MWRSERGHDRQRWWLWWEEKKSRDEIYNTWGFPAILYTPTTPITWGERSWPHTSSMFQLYQADGWEMRWRGRRRNWWWGRWRRKMRREEIGVSVLFKDRYHPWLWPLFTSDTRGTRCAVFSWGGVVYVVMQIRLHAQPQHKILQSHVPGGELHKRTQQVRITQQLTSNCISKSGCSKAPDCFTYIKVELWFTKCPVVLTKTSQTLRVFWNTQDTQTATDK